VNLAPIALSALALALPVARLDAQLDSATASRLRDSYRIRLELTSHERFDARFTTIEPSALVVQSIVRPTFEKSFFVERRVPLDSLARVWVSGTQFRNGAIVGGIVFGGLGLVFGAATAGDSDAGLDRCAPALCIAGGAIGFGVIGLLAGGVLGSLLPRWSPVWPR